MSLPDDVYDLDLITASLRADAADTGSFLEALATKLETALPGRVTVTRRRQGLRGPKEVRAIAVDADTERLELQREGDRIETTRARRSGGITLRTERLEMDVWLAILSTTLSEQARSSGQTREALERLLGL